MREDEEHYFLCNVCGQPIDMRDLGAVLAHETPHSTWLNPMGQPIIGTLGRRIQ